MGTRRVGKMESLRWGGSGGGWVVIVKVIVLVSKQYPVTAALVIVPSKTGARVPARAT